MDVIPLYTRVQLALKEGDVMLGIQSEKGHIVAGVGVMLPPPDYVEQFGLRAVFFKLDYHGPFGDESDRVGNMDTVAIVAPDNALFTIRDQFEIPEGMVVVRAMEGLELQIAAHTYIADLKVRNLNFLQGQFTWLAFSLLVRQLLPRVLRQPA